MEEFIEPFHSVIKLYSIYLNLAFFPSVSITVNNLNVLTHVNVTDVEKSAEKRGHKIFLRAYRYL